MPMMDPQEMEKLKARVEQLESKLEFLYRRLGIAQAGEAPKGVAPVEQLPKWKPSPMVLALVRKGDKTAAMKAFIQETGASLKDAKTFIDSL
jgi:ribosomal protein L7/L12